MFLKRKRCGKVKARGCADGRKQRDYISSEDAASPTVATEAVFITAVIDGMENREVAVVDVPGAFMQVDMDSVVHVRFNGKMVDLLVEIDHDAYAPYITYEGRDKVIYVELLKALYGTIRAARLFWEKLSGKLQEWGFNANKYDPCVANKMVNGKQLTVAWHVDDLKVSHVDVHIVDEFLNQMEQEFGKETPMNKSRGKIHDYLGMILDYSQPGVVKIDMTEYVKMVLHDIPVEMIGVATTPAANHLFDINEESEKLNDDKKSVFVHYVMQLLYLSQRGRPDIRTAISFLCTRLKQPDQDDYGKLIRVLKYLQSTIDLPLILSGDNAIELRWWVDASYGVHGDMKGHTGGTLTMGAGSIYSTSTKQKMVTRSSTESEVVGVYDVLPQMLWTANFIRDQGYSVITSVLYQDNQSAMLLETNGRKSSTKRTRHMNIRYFYIKDNVDRKEIKIEYCATDKMLADFFTKALQGLKFCVMRDRIMNIDHSSKYHSGHRSVLKNDSMDNDVAEENVACEDEKLG
jgi:Reverse transcriptase (RNA-dependent DNA polymerase)